MKQASLFLKEILNNNPTIKAQLASAEQTVLAGEKTSFVAAQDLLDMYFEELKG